MTATAANCVHLTVESVLEIHGEVLAAHGGAAGIRDRGLLEAAVAAPQATGGGASPFAGAMEIAAAYLFYLCRNRAFNAGNKRTAMTASIVFLRLNDIEPAPDSKAWEELVLDVAASRIARDETTKRLRKLLRQRKTR